MIQTFGEGIKLRDDSLFWFEEGKFVRQRDVTPRPGLHGNWCFARTRTVAFTSLFVLPISLLIGTARDAAAQYDSHQLGGGLELNTPTPTNALEHNNRGVELGCRGLWSLAIDEAEVAVKASPDSDIFRRNLSAACLRYGVLLEKEQRTPEAIDLYRKALFADFDNCLAASGLNNCLRRLGKNPIDISCRLLLAEQAEKSRLCRVAAVEYRACTLLDDSAVNNYKLGRCLIDADSMSRGHQALKTAMNKNWTKEEQVDKAACQSLLAEIESKNRVGGGN